MRYGTNYDNIEVIIGALFFNNGTKYAELKNNVPAIQILLTALDELAGKKL